MTCTDLIPKGCGFSDRCSECVFNVIPYCSRACQRKHKSIKCKQCGDPNYWHGKPLGDYYRHQIYSSIPAEDVFGEILQKGFQPQIEAAVRAGRSYVHGMYWFEGGNPRHAIMESGWFWNQFCSSKVVVKTARLVCKSVGILKEGIRVGWQVDFYLARQPECPKKSAGLHLHKFFKEKRKLVSGLLPIGDSDEEEPGSDGDYEPKRKRNSDDEPIGAGSDADDESE